MLLKPYRILKDRLTGIPNVKLIDFFNDQYSGIIHAQPGIFIEFHEDLNFETLNFKVKQAELKLRIHIYSKILTDTDKSINEANLETHEAIYNEVVNRLEGYNYKEGDKLLFNSLTEFKYAQEQKVNGWHISFHDFEAMIYKFPTVTTHAKPSPNINVQFKK